MEISFETRQLRAICRDAAEAEASIGPLAAARLRQVLADLRAADALFDLADFIDLPAEGQNELVLTVEPTHRLVLRCGNRTPPRSPSGEIDWNAVDRLKVMEITANGEH